MTNQQRAPVSVQRPVWMDAEQVDETDLSLQQTADDVIEASIIANHTGDGVLPENLVPNILFNSSLFVGYLDGVAVQSQAQPSDNNYGNQLAISLTGSNASGSRRIKVCIIGLDFQSNLQYEIFYFDTNETQVSRQHFTKILLLLFNDLLGNPILSFNLGGTLIISEVAPMTLSRDVIMIAQNQQPNLFFRDFFLDFSVNTSSLQIFLQNALPLYDISALNIYTQPLDNLALLSGDITTQIGEKFQATTNNIQKISLLLSVRNQVSGQQNNLVWTGDLVLSIYPLQTSVDCITDLIPGTAIQFSPSSIPIAQISFNYNSLEAAGILLSSVPQPVDFTFSNSPVANGNLMTPGQYYCIALKRAGAANQCDILMAVGQALVPNSNVSTYAGTLWVDIPTQNLWFIVWTDAAKLSDGQAYDAGHGVIIPKTTLDVATQATVDNIFGAQQFVGGDTYMAVMAANTQYSDSVPDQRTGNPVNSRQQYVPAVSLLGTIDIANLEKASNPLILGSISDKNVKSFETGQANINSVLYSATMVQDQLFIRIVDDPTDTTRFNPEVTGLITNLLNGNFISATFTPDNGGAPFTSYRIAEAQLQSMIVGDVDGNGIIDINDLNLLNQYIGYNFNTGLPVNTSIITNSVNTTFVNGYITLTQPFANLFDISFQLVDPTTTLVVASAADGVLVANPTNLNQAQFTSASINFNDIIGLSTYNLVILSNGANQANYGGWTIVSLNSIQDVLTIQKIYLTPLAIGQMLRSDIDGDFAITYADGYLLENYIDRTINPVIPAPTYPAPTSNAYDKIGTRFNVIQLRVEELIDRMDDYAADPALRASTVHPVQDIFLSDGYLASHNYYSSPIQMSFAEELVWEPYLVVSSSQPRFVPTIFGYENGFAQNSCSIQGIQYSVYPAPLDFDPGHIDVFVPNNLILGQGGELQRPDGYFYKVDFEVGTVILEIPDGLFGTEKTIDVMNDFIVDYTGNGATRLGFPSMRFADCSFISSNAIADDQIRFSVSMQSFSPNTNGLSTDGYYGAIVDGKMGIRMDYQTGLLTVNFTNLYQDPTLQTLSTKVQVSVFLKKGGFNNQTLFVDSTKVQNMLSLISVFSGANDGGPSAQVDLGNDVINILPIINGGTGLNAVGISGTVLTSNGTGVNYQYMTSSIVGYTPATPGNWASTAPSTVQQALDRMAALLETHYGPIP